MAQFSYISGLKGGQAEDAESSRTDLLHLKGFAFFFFTRQLSVQLLLLLLLVELQSSYRILNLFFPKRSINTPPLTLMCK